MSQSSSPADPTIMSLLAGDPDAPEGLLSALTSHALSTSQTSRISPLVRELVTHPRTPRADLVRLVTAGDSSVLALAVTRPDLTLAEVDGLVGRSRNNVVLRSALSSTCDQDGAVHGQWVSRSKAGDVLVAAMGAANDQVRAVAVDKLVARKHLANEERSAVAAYLRRFPQARERLVELCKDEVYRTSLLSDLEGSAQGEPAVGTRAWLYRAGTAPADVLAVARQGGPVSLFAWQEVVSDAAEPSSVVLGEALDAAGSDPTVLVRVLGSSAASVDQQVFACQELLRRGPALTSRAREALANAAVSADPQVAAAYVRSAGDPANAKLLRERADLDPATVQALFDLVGRGFVPGAPTQRTLSEQRVAWGAWFATHPGATPEVRAAGLEWATDLEHEHTVRPYNAAQRPAAKAMWGAAAAAARAGVEHGSDLVELGRALPYSAISALGVRDGAGVVAALRAAVRRELERAGWDLDAGVRVAALAMLREQFPGTVGELLDGAAGITA